MQPLFITGTDTEIGKTVTSAALTEAWQADYWKPIQAGDLDNSDSMKIARWVSNNKTQIHPERYRLNHPMSPHAAAALDGIHIDLKDFSIPQTDNLLLIEGAGGLYVPINEDFCIIDLIKKLDVPVILTSKNYLGSINHTLLSINALKGRGIAIHGIVFNGESNPETERIILKMTGIKRLGTIKKMKEINKASIKEAFIPFD